MSVEFYLHLATVAVYNTDYNLMYPASKLAPSTCVVYSHELYITRFGIDILNLQYSIGSPILKTSCSYTNDRYLETILRPMLV
jgi:hypothetical protein